MVIGVVNMRISKKFLVACGAVCALLCGDACGVKRHDVAEKSLDVTAKVIAIVDVSFDSETSTIKLIGDDGKMASLEDRSYFIEIKHKMKGKLTLTSDFKVADDSGNTIEYGGSLFLNADDVNNDYLLLGKNNSVTRTLDFDKDQKLRLVLFPIGIGEKETSDWTLGEYRGSLKINLSAEA
jgi:hypothetical protein